MARYPIKITISAEVNGILVDKVVFSTQPDFTETGHKRLEKAIEIYVNHLKVKHPEAVFSVTIPSRMNNWIDARGEIAA